MNGTPLAQVEPMGLWCDTIGRNEYKLFFLCILDIYIILIDSHAKINVYHEEARDSTYC